MANINSIFIDVQTSGAGLLDFIMTPGWNDNGLPIMDVVSSGAVPKGIEVRTLLFPSGTGLDEAEFASLIDRSNYTELAQLVRDSGYYFDMKIFNNSGIYDHRFEISQLYENTHYELGYLTAFPQDPNGTSTFEEITAITNQVALSKPSRPNPNNLYISSSIISEVIDETYLNLGLFNKREMTNFDAEEYNDPTFDPYIIIIENNETGAFLRPDGSVLPGLSEKDSTNYFDSSLDGMYVTLPLISGDVGQTQSTYSIKFANVSRENEETQRLIFDTSLINISSDEFNEGDLSSFDDVSSKKIGEVPIKSDVVQKKRYMVGIEDIGIVNETYVKQGTYISDFYTIDDPLYTFFLRTSEVLPEVPQVDPHSKLRYYVQFHNQDWIRISPNNRGHEVDEDNNTVPKFIVLDDLNIGQVSTDLIELLYDLPIFSFRIKIEFDMSFIDNTNFISPSVDFFECHVTDRNSFLQVS